MVNRGELPGFADLSPIITQNLHMVPFMNSTSIETSSVPLHQFETKFSPVMFEKVQEESFSSQLRFHRPVIKSNVSFFKKLHRGKNDNMTFPIVINQHPPFISKPRVPQHSASTSREALDMTASNMLLKDQRFIWARRSVVHKENPTYKTFAEKNRDNMMAIESVLRYLSKMLEECDSKLNMNTISTNKASIY
jgi:hypothetical protein